jgi:hypothetical protein
LSLCLALFLVDAAVSLLDDSLILFFGLHIFSLFRGLVAIFGALMALGVYGLIGLTPMVPKKLFLPIPLFHLSLILVAFPFAIYCYGRLQQLAVGVSACQVMVGVGILCWSQGGFKLRWPLVPKNRLGFRRFSWWNLSAFTVANVFVLLPAIIVYSFFCTGLAVNHFTDGFMALHPGGLTVQMRKYVRNDGKTIQLFPMAHVADADFYRKVSQSFPTNSVILMEGVTDEKNLLTNGISYKRMANALGLAEQHEEFSPCSGERVCADVDVDQFSPETIDCLNLGMLVHSKGLIPEVLVKLMQSSPTRRTADRLFEDILRKRNQHLMEEIKSHLSQSDYIIVPWGVIHLPGLAAEIQKSGFHLDATQEYTLVRFHQMGNQPKGLRP